MPSALCTAKSPGCFVIIEDTGGESPVQYYYKQEAATPAEAQGTKIELNRPTLVAILKGGLFAFKGNICPFYHTGTYQKAVRGGFTVISVVAREGYIWKQVDSMSKPASGTATPQKQSSTQNLRTPPGAASPGSVTPSRKSRPHDGQYAVDMTEVNKRLQNC